jgi:hypothetical protein
MEEGPMKYFMIKYQFKNGTREEWHRKMAAFVAALDSDPDLKGRISYRCMKSKDGADYFHLAAAADDRAPKDLQAKDFFSRYTEQTKLVAGGEVQVVPLEVIAETSFRA